MKIIDRTGKENLAYVYLAEVRDGGHIEFVESIQPPMKREEKWVFVISTLLGCPVKCPMCDAGGWYKGRLSKEEILGQIDYMIDLRYTNRKIPIQKFKIQFCRMGEPSFNPHVLEALRELPSRYDAPGIKPSISSVAPKGCENFFEELISIKNEFYKKQFFQLQFSIHTTDEKIRDQIIPIKKWNLKQIGEYGKKYFRDGDQKVTLNFALAKNHPLDPKILSQYFNPSLFLIKLTPLNPTVRADKHQLKSFIEPKITKKVENLVQELKSLNYEVILNIGYYDEDKIGSNCGQYVRRFLENDFQGGQYLYEKNLEYIGE